ncbi:HU family DNA-binding protein (plasmid) [Microvirga sp. RSM25]|uniref:HU family DNA-binding protein n=1 Tax=Microvirga sp. RSM25 TaxID=3273802 RepID=UPI00384E230C
MPQTWLIKSSRRLAPRSSRGGSVKLSLIGVFTVRRKGKPPGHHPWTGGEVPIAPRKVIPFNASARAKAHINRASSLHRVLTS